MNLIRSLIPGLGAGGVLAILQQTSASNLVLMIGTVGTFILLQILDPIRRFMR